MIERTTSLTTTAHESSRIRFPPTSCALDRGGLKFGALLYLPGCAQHVIQHGNNREACFYDAADYKAYLSFLKDAAAKYRVAIHAFVLMTNHVHVLVTPSDEMGVSRMMQAQGRNRGQSALSFKSRP